LCRPRLKSSAFNLKKLDWSKFDRIWKTEEGKIIWQVKDVGFVKFVNTKIWTKYKKTIFTLNVDRVFKFCECYNSMKDCLFAAKSWLFFQSKEQNNIPKNQAKIFLPSKENLFLLRKCRPRLKSLAFCLEKFHLNKIDCISKRTWGKIIWKVKEVCFINFVNTKTIHKISKINDGHTACRPAF
jgi:hypothetical protein